MLSFKEAVKFHGHCGPFLAIGYRIGKFARKKFNSKGIMDISCVVKLPNKKPFSCVVDGIQCSTGCTFGKGNIKLKPMKNGVHVIFKNKDGNILIMKLCSEILEYALNCKKPEFSAYQILKKPITEIVEIHRKWRGRKVL